MATDRPDESDADTGWIFEPQAEDEAGLTYRGESPRAGSAPGAPASGAPAAPITPAAFGPRSAPKTPITPSDFSDPADTGQATAAFTPDWEAALDPRPSTGSGPQPAAAVGAHAGVAAVGQPAARGVGSPGSPNRLGGGPPASGGPGRGIALGALVGTIVLLLAWFFLLRDPGSDATRATPVRTTAASVSPSATPKPSRTRNTTAPARTTSRPSPTATSAAPSASATPTSSLNDASNRLGWTYIIDGLGPVKLGLNAAEATALGVLQEVPSACDAHSATDLLGATRVYSTGGKVTAIDIRTDAFPSGRGIRVGTPLENLKNLYGDALKSTSMTDGGNQIKQWALTSNTQFVAYVVDGAGNVSRIAIGYRGTGGTITLPPPC